MKRFSLFLFGILLCSCNDNGYAVLNEENVLRLSIKDTLVKNDRFLVLMAGDSPSDEFPNILVEPTSSGKKKYYLFDSDTELENDSTLVHYYPAFLIDDEGEFRKNGLWVYTSFKTEGTFPFHSEVMSFSVDSVPQRWKGKLPVKEGIYFYEKNSLVKLYDEQSEEKFKEQKRDGFYFLPNNGRLYDKINIYDLD